MPGRDLFDGLLRAVRRYRSPPPIPRLVRPSIERFEALHPASLPLRLDGLVDAWPGQTNTDFDPSQPHNPRLPLSRADLPLDAIIQSSDALYVPSRSLHHVPSLCVRITFSGWWAAGTRAVVVRAV